MSHRRRLAGLAAVPALVATSLIALPGPAATAAPADATAAVTAAVGGKLLDHARRQGLAGADARDVRVTVSRRDGNRWAFGTAVAVAPRVEGAYPVGSVFVARAVGGSWQVAFDGEAAFGELAAEATAPVVTESE
ncbi:MAG TPA: peptidase M23, partial [Micromonospora sp.]